MFIARPYLFGLLLLPLLISVSGCQTAASLYTATFGHLSSDRAEATTPAPRTKEFPWMSVSRWYEMHAEDVDVANTQSPEVLFLGDSITESWAWGEGRDEVYQRYFSDYSAANFAIGGDQTQNLLWRLQHNIDGELSPSAVVLMIGVNNFLHSQHSAHAVAAGVEAVLEQTQQNYPNANILLVGILPFHQHGTDSSRQLVTEANASIAELADQQRVFYTDVNHLFLDQQGNIPQRLMDDFIHPSAAGLEIIAENVEPLIQPWVRGRQVQPHH